MEDAVFFEIAQELKGLHKTGVEAVARGDLANAVESFERALKIARTVGYREGCGHARFNLASTYALQGRVLLALRAQLEARTDLEAGSADHERCDEAIRKLCLLVKRRGIEHERAGEFAAAVEHFSTAMPHADSKSRTAMEHEVTLLKRILNEDHRRDRGGAQGAEPQGD